MGCSGGIRQRGGEWEDGGDGEDGEDGETRGTRETREMENSEAWLTLPGTLAPHALLPPAFCNKIRDSITYCPLLNAIL
jgi:hypothetical protein